MSQYAIIQTGGKQYRVEAGDVVDVELLNAEPKANVEFKEVLFFSNGEEKKVGTPVVEQAVVRGVVKEIVRGPKVINFKYKRTKSSTRRKVGHRQTYTRVEITELATS